MKSTSRFLQVAGRSALGIVVGAALLTWGTPSSAEATPKGAVTYQVKPGDSLWRISRRHYGSPHHWSMLYFANREVIGPSTRILHPGMRLILPPLARSADASAIPEPASAMSPEATPAAEAALAAGAAEDSSKDAERDPVSPDPATQTPLKEVSQAGLEASQEPQTVFELPDTPPLFTESSRFVSPAVAAASSVLLPGSGQILRGHWDRGLAHLGITAFSIGALQVGTQGADPMLRWTGSLALVGVSLWSAWDAYHEPKAELTVDTPIHALRHGTD